VLATKYQTGSNTRKRPLTGQSVRRSMQVSSAENSRSEARDPPDDQEDRQPGNCLRQYAVGPLSWALSLQADTDAGH
jgi:hypothetical protein